MGQAAVATPSSKKPAKAKGSPLTPNSNVQSSKKFNGRVYRFGARYTPDSYTMIPLKKEGARSARVSDPAETADRRSPAILDADRGIESADDVLNRTTSVTKLR